MQTFETEFKDLLKFTKQEISKRPLLKNSGDLLSPSDYVNDAYIVLHKKPFNKGEYKKIIVGLIFNEQHRLSRTDRILENNIQFKTNKSVVETAKVCSKCKEEKPLNAFYKDNKIPGAVLSQCKKCMGEVKASNEYFAEYRKENREKMRLADRRYKAKQKRLPAKNVSSKPIKSKLITFDCVFNFRSNNIIKKRLVKVAI